MKRRLNMLFLIGPSIIICYTIIYLYHYQQLPEIVVGHRDLTGKVDGYTEKSFIWIPILFNIIIVAAIGYLSTKPEILNYPGDINSDNKQSVYKKVQIFLCLAAIIVSALFSLIIFDAVGLLKTENTVYFLGYFFLAIVGIPLLVFKVRV